MMKTRNTVLLGLILGMSIVSAASAGEAMNFVGLSVGQTNFNNDNLSGITPGTKDDRGNAWKIYLGFPVTNNLSIEVAHANLGKQSITGTIPPAVTSVRDEATARIYDGAVLFSYHATDSLAIFAKAGAYWWSMNTKTTRGAGGAANDDGFNVLYGAGAMYNVTNEVVVRAEWERLNHLGFKGTAGRSNVDLLTVGLQYNFKFF